MHVKKGVGVGALDEFNDFGVLVAASGQSFIQHYEYGFEPLAEFWLSLWHLSTKNEDRQEPAYWVGDILIFLEEEEEPLSANVARNHKLDVVIGPSCFQEVSKELETKPLGFKQWDLGRRFF